MSLPQLSPSLFYFYFQGRIKLQPCEEGGVPLFTTPIVSYWFLYSPYQINHHHSSSFLCCHLCYVCMPPWHLYFLSQYDISTSFNQFLEVSWMRFKMRVCLGIFVFSFVVSNVGFGLPPMLEVWQNHVWAKLFILTQTKLYVHDYNCCPIVL